MQHLNKNQKVGEDDVVEDNDVNDSQSMKPNAG